MSHETRPNYIESIIAWNFTGTDWALDLTPGQFPTLREVEREWTYSISRLRYSRKKNGRPPVKYIYSISNTAAGPKLRAIIQKTADTKADITEIQHCFGRFKGRVTQYRKAEWFHRLPTAQIRISQRTFNTSHNLIRKYGMLDRPHAVTGA